MIKTVKMPQKNKNTKQKSAIKRGVAKSILSLLFALIAVCLAIMIFSYTENQTFKESFVQATSSKAFNRVRVVQISDLHGTEYGAGNAELLSRLEKLQPDIVVMTGDIMDSEADLNKTIAFCNNIAAIAPTYYIYGNNETDIAFGMYMDKEIIDSKLGANDQNRDPQKLYALDSGLKKQIEKTGVKVLFNEYDTIQAGKTYVDVYGVLTSNPSAFWPYAGDTFHAFMTENPSHYKLFAVHEPMLFSNLTDVESWGDLAVCGHTHGGVVRLPIIGAVYSQEDGLFPERKGGLVRGKYTAAGTQVYVNVGLTNNGMIRINNKPEIAIIDINRY